MSDKDIDDLLNKKVKVLFGLEAQGHIPLVEEKLKTWWPRFFDENKFQVWEDIAKEIGWIDYAVCDSYIKHLQRKSKDSTPNAKLKELIAKYEKREKDPQRPPYEQEAYAFAAYDLKQLIEGE